MPIFLSPASQGMDSKYSLVGSGMGADKDASAAYITANYRQNHVNATNNTISWLGLLVSTWWTSLFMASGLLLTAYGRTTSYSIPPAIKQTQWRGWPLMLDHRPGILTAMRSIISTTLPSFRTPISMRLSFPKSLRQGKGPSLGNL